MSILLHGDCLEEMKGMDDKSIDFIFCDLPYNQTSCKWDQAVLDLEQFWKQIMRIKKLNTPIFMTTTTKFGVSLINSAPKKCPFRYDIVWVKSAPAGFLCAKKMPMRKHEMIYVFYEKLPFYDLSSHKHKFIKERDTEQTNGKIYEGGGGVNKKTMEGKYEPALPVSVVKEEEKTVFKTECETAYGKATHHSYRDTVYDPPLPVSVVKEEEKGCYGEKVPNSEAKYGQKCSRQYDPPLPVSVVKEEDKGCYGDANRDIEEYKKCGKKGKNQVLYDPPLPVSVVKQESIYGGACNGKTNADEEYRKMGRKNGESAYDPPLPTTMLEVKSTRGKHSTEKPVALMEWLLKYYSKEGDVVLDPTMGSGSTGVACKNMNRNFVGIEMDEEIYEVACKRVWGD